MVLRVAKECPKHAFVCGLTQCLEYSYGFAGVSRKHNSLVGLLDTVLFWILI